MKIVEGEYIDAGDWVTARFRVIGVQDGPMPPFPASNKPFPSTYARYGTLTPADRPIKGHNYSDGLGMLMQLGHLPAPA